MNDAERLQVAAGTLVRAMLRAGKTLATAESCTGGWVAKAVTDIPGSSGCFGYGIVSYSNAAKQALLGVSAATLDRHGAVSEATVREMAEGAMRRSGADMAVAVSGVAGPGGGSADKPAGTVWFCWTSGSGGSARIETALHRLEGDREQVRRQSVLIALAGVQERLESHG